MTKDELVRLINLAQFAVEDSEIGKSMLQGKAIFYLDADGQQMRSNSAYEIFLTVLRSLLPTQSIIRDDPLGSI